MMKTQGPNRAELYSFYKAFIINFCTGLTKILLSKMSNMLI